MRYDFNGDGKLQLFEIVAIIGKCKYVPGLNIIKIFPVDGGHVIHHWNWHDVNRNGQNGSM
jgi:hypothetical protein